GSRPSQTASVRPCLPSPGCQRAPASPAPVGPLAILASLAISLKQRGSPSAHLVHFDDVAVRIIEEDLLPTLHRPSAEVGVGNAVLLEATLERLDVVGAKGDVTTLDRIDDLAGAEAHAKILLGQVNCLLPSVTKATLPG